MRSVKDHFKSPQYFLAISTTDDSAPDTITTESTSDAMTTTDTMTTELTTMEITTELIPACDFGYVDTSYQACLTNAIWTGWWNSDHPSNAFTMWLTFGGPECTEFQGNIKMGHSLCMMHKINTSLRIPDSYDAKIAKICNLWTLWPVFQLINNLFKIRQKPFLPNVGF